MNKIISVAIIGCGGRGLGAFGRPMQTRFHDKFHVCALCDISTARLENAGKELGVEEGARFTDENAFFAQKRAELLVIATQDRDHARHILKGLSLGYDILVEKPLSSSREECLSLLEAQKQSGRGVFVCHELRYAPAFRKADEILLSGELGRLISIAAVEKPWYGHFVHSYVRGSWRRSEDSSPVILAKSSHDLDLLQYYARARCETISSTGALSGFKAENAPEGAADRCTDCRYVDSCPYSAKRLYVDRMKNRPDYVFSTIICRPDKPTPERVMQAIRTGPYGRCVYRCDNDVCDNQQCLMRFENGVTATFEMNAFTGNGGREMTFHCSLGELILSEVDDVMCIKKFGREEHEKFSLSSLVNAPGGHGGGDDALILSLHGALTGKEKSATSLENSVESHLMGIAAEESRLRGGEMMYVHGRANPTES